MPCDSLLTAKRTIGCKLEGTPYTEETLTAADYNVSAYNISYNIDLPVKERKIATGDFGKLTGTPGRRAFSFQFSVDVQWSGTATTAPAYFKALQACAMAQTTDTVVRLTASSKATCSPITVEIPEMTEGTSPSQLVYKAKGCMGNAKLVCDAIGTPMRIDFDFKGALVGVSDRANANILVPTGLDLGIAEAMLSVTASLFGDAPRFSKLTIDLGNTVEMYTKPGDSSGYEGAHVTMADPKVEIDPDMLLLATSPWFTRHAAGTVGAFNVTIGQHMIVKMPSVQILASGKSGEREGHVVDNLSIGVLGDQTGGGIPDHALQIVHGSQA